MADCINISIAHIPVQLELEGLPQAVRDQIIENYTAFTDQSAAAGIQVKIRVEDAAPFIAPEYHAVWQVQTSRKKELIEFKSFYEQGWINLRARQAEVTLNPKGHPENFFRVLYAWECLEQGGLLLHASGVIRGGKGYVFFGHSTAGKTTAARLSLERDCIILSDDMVILGFENGRPWLYGVPFRGRFPEAPRTNASAPLCGCYSIIKDKEHFVKSLLPSEAMARLAACVPFVMEDPFQVQRVLAVCAQIEKTTNIKELHFRKDAGFWEVIDD